MTYQITSDELAWRKRKVVRMYAISFALVCVIALPAVHADPQQYIIPGIGTGLICLVAAFFTIKRSLATLQRFPIEVTAEAITLPYQNKLMRIPYDAIDSVSLQDDIRRPPEVWHPLPTVASPKSSAGLMPQGLPGISRGSCREGG